MHRLFANVLGLVIAAPLLVAGSLAAERPEPSGQAHQTVVKPASERTAGEGHGRMMAGQQERMMDRCRAMMDRQRQMKEEFSAMGARLDELLEAMKEASGEEKVQAMEAVLEELVAQRSQRHGMMMANREETRRHMMEHMAAMHEMGASMMERCPMMRGMEDPVEEETEDPHAEHHP